MSLQFIPKSSSTFELLEALEVFAEPRREKLAVQMLVASFGRRLVLALLAILHVLVVLVAVGICSLVTGACCACLNDAMLLRMIFPCFQNLVDLLVQADEGCARAGRMEVVVRIDQPVQHVCRRPFGVGLLDGHSSPYTRIHLHVVRVGGMQLVKAPDDGASRQQENLLFAWSTPLPTNVTESGEDRYLSPLPLRFMHCLADFSKCCR